MARRWALEEREDAYGRLMLEWHEGRPAAEMVERDDERIEANRGPLQYFQGPGGAVSDEYKRAPPGRHAAGLLVATITGEPPDMDAWQNMAMPDHFAMKGARISNPWGGWDR